VGSICTGSRSPSTSSKWSRARYGGAGCGGRIANGSELAASRSGHQGAGRAGGVGGGGLYGVALRRGGDRRRRLRGAPRRASRHPGGAGTQAPCQDRSQRLPTPRELLQRGELPESWIPPEAVLEWRERVRLYKSLVDQRTQWTQRIHAELYQHGVAVPDGNIRARATRAWVTGDAVGLSAAGRQRIEAGYRMIDAADARHCPSSGRCNASGRANPHARPSSPPTTASAV
jgi:hypothetical protein